MRRPHRSSSLLGIAVLLALGGCLTESMLALSAHAQTQPASKSRPSAQTQTPPSSETGADVRQILVDRIDTNKKSVGIVVGVITPQGAKIYSYGKTAMDAGQPVTADTIYEIGSMTKVFTSLLLADMVQRGEVKLDDPVSKYLPANVKVPERNGRKITLVDLATHTSGLPRLPSNMKPKNALNPYADYSVDQMYAFLSGYELTRDIGSQYEYSNLGGGLLGHALARRAGMDYETLVKTRITAPLTMQDTVITLTPQQRERMAQGHNPVLHPTPAWDLPTLAGAGALRSTANDILKFLAANIGLTASPLAPAMKSMLDVRKPTGIPNMDIALGWHVFHGNDSEIIWHNGGTGGFHTFMGFNRGKNNGVVVLSSAANDIDDIGMHLLDKSRALAKFAPPVAHKEVVVDPKVFDRYVGKYEVAPGVIAEIARKGDSIFAQLTGQPQFQLFAESETEFFFKVVDAQVTFVLEGEKATKLVIHQAGQNVPARRME